MDQAMTALAFAGALAAAAVYGGWFCTRPDPGPVGAAVKAASTGLLAALLWVAAAGTPGLWPMALGLALGAAGDWFLARRGEAAFLAGMAAFAAGHLAYAGAMLARSAGIGFDGWTPAEALAAAVLGATLLSTPAWLLPRAGALRGPVAGYVAVIGLMGLAAILLPAHPGRGWLRAGAALFIVSDLLLALRLFVVADPARQDLLSRLLWPAYWAGQALIGGAAMRFWATGG
jgi:uncharacterized membrane protein YhhN